MGLNAEEIHDRVATGSLAQIYAALTYYHSNTIEIEGYLAEEKRSTRIMRSGNRCGDY
jgi:uncharacterized protein (DUF433 family)